MLKKFVIYTVVVGGYDDIKQPLAIDDSFDYVLFSDNLPSGTNVGIWQVRAIDYDDNDIFRRSRYPKILPTKVLSGYEASLYIDGTLQIATQYVYDRFVELYNENVEWGGICHFDNNCIYNEIISITNLFWVHDYDSIKIYSELKKAGFPEQYGLYENNCIFRLHCPSIDEIGKLWWSTILEGVRRDQFTLMYCLWKIQVSRSNFLPMGELPRVNSIHFCYYIHNPHKRVLKLSINEKIRKRVFRYVGNGGLANKTIYDRISLYKYPKMMLFIYEIYYTFKNGTKVLLEIWKMRLSKNASSL